MTEKKQDKAQPLNEDTLDDVKGGGNIEMAAWHELVILGDVAAAPKGAPQIKAPGGRG